MVNASQQPVKNSIELLSCVESPSSAVAVPQSIEDRYSVTSSAVPSAVEELPALYKNRFFSLLGLVAARSSVLRKPSEVIECNVIVIDEDEDDDQVPLHQGSNCISDLFGTTRPLRGDVQVNGNATGRLLQPCSRLRKLLSIDISSPLGSRTLQYVVSTLQNDVMPLNPYTVSHSLAGSDNTLDYGTFCRTPVKGKFSGRLRQREFPVKYKHSSAGTHYHYYCFGHADRRRFCQRFDTGLSGRSRRLRQKYNSCSVAMERLTADEISDWRSSQRLHDYVMRMAEKEKAAATVSSSCNATVDEVICLSSDSEDEVSSPVKKQQELMFRCHQCDVQLPCGRTFRGLIRDHYRSLHGIVNIDIVHFMQPDGSVSMQVIHVPSTDTQTASRSSSVSLSSSDTCSAPSTEHASSVYLLHPSPSQTHALPVSCSMPGQVQTWPSGSGDSLAATSITNEKQASAHTNALRQSHGHAVTLLKHNVQSCETITTPVPTKLYYRNSTLLNGSVMCRGDAVNDMAASSQSACDADVICLD